MFVNLSRKLSLTASRRYAGSQLATSTRAFSAEATFDLTGCFQTHNLDSAPSESVTATKEDLVEMFELMYTMRRMEITCDQEYKARNIRGFCHLYDGQEAVATGIINAFDDKDSYITSYRCHCVALARGGSVKQVVGELFGVAEGLSKGKGGSMHFYNKKHNFYGGQGIVGAQVPCGAGLAFANKYRGNTNVSLTYFGDGAANQGQIFEAYRFVKQLLVQAHRELHVQHDLVVNGQPDELSNDLRATVGQVGHHATETQAGEVGRTGACPHLEIGDAVGHSVCVEPNLVVLQLHTHAWHARNHSAW